NLQKRLEEVDKLIREWNSADKAAVAWQYNKTEADVLKRITKLNSMASYYRRLLSEIEKGANLSQDLARLQENGSQPGQSLVTEEPPYSLSFYESYLADLESTRKRINTLKRSAAFSQSAIEAAEAELGRAQSQLRILQEQVDKVGTDAVPELTWEYEGVKIDEELNRVNLAFQKEKLSNLRMEIKSLELSLERSRKGVNWIKENLQYNEEDLQEHIQEMQKAAEVIRERIAVLQKEKEGAEKDLVKAQAESEILQDPARTDLANASLKRAQTWLEYYQFRIEHSEEILQYLNEAQQIWQQRYSLLKGEFRTEDLFSLRKETEARIEKIEQLLLSQQDNLSSVNSRLTLAEQELSRPDLAKELKEQLSGSTEALDKMLEDNLEYASRLTMIFNLNERLLEEVESRLAAVEITRKVSTFSREKILGFLNTELLSGEGYSLTVRKLILAVLILTLGLLFSKKITTAVKNRLVGKNVDPTASMAVQKIIYYVLIFTVIMVTLKMVNIPLTAFAFLGGALALAIGFGAQSFFSNILTGFILMFQKPIKINDMILIDGTYCIVEEIGSRATTVRDFDNVEIMIPNSYFLSNKIINFTHSDKIVRGTVGIGVAYGSPVREVERLLYEVASKHSKILKKPEPVVVFEEFGDSALIFKLFFWVDMAKDASRYYVASDLRYMIDNVFAKNGIVIAFPQMDVHLDVISRGHSGNGNSSPEKDEQQI
ncbi:MAG TPA: mechanosensitive ion channel, partial [Synergistales bacterium]|nr:mechanosensitive ion channel [Synergistales bacterium]